jgi:hypothetical protein
VEPLSLVALGVILVLGRLAWVASDRRVAVRRRIRAAARVLGLETANGSWASGRIDGFRVEIRPLGSGSYAELSVDSASRPGACIPPDLMLRSVTVAERLQNEEDVRTGDEPFDNVLRIEGKPDAALALLDGTTRQLIDEALATNLRVWDGRVCRDVDSENLVKEVRRAVELAGRLTLSPESIPHRLAQNARADPVAGVRLRNLDALLQHYPEGSCTRGTLSDLLKDAFAEVRLRAAIASGPKGYPTLTRLVGSPEASEKTELEALDFLIAHVPQKSQWPFIDSALKHRSRWVRERALGQVVRVGGPKALPRLAQLLADPDVELALEATRAIGKLGDSSCEPALIKAIATEDLRLRKAAAEALGALGTAAAVLPLQQMIGGAAAAILTPDLRKAAHDAIRQIQSRLPRAEAGQLSLARSGDAQGQVSLAALASEGELAVADRQERAKRPIRRTPGHKKAAR